MLTFVCLRSTVYAVKGGFLGHFGKNPTWWLVVILTVLAVVVFELSVTAIRKVYLPNDVDIFQELEQDPVLRRRFEEAAAGGGTDDKYSADDSEIQKEHAKREGEIQDLLDSRVDFRETTGHGPGRSGDSPHSPAASPMASRAVSPTGPRKRLHSDSLSPTGPSRMKYELGFEEHELTTITSGQVGPR
jgi:uncharacterized membrane protein